MVKVCSKCKVEKPLTEFYKRNDNKSGFRNDCKDCLSKRKKKYYKENKKEHQKRGQKYYQLNKDEIKLRTKKWRENNNEYYKESMKKYFKNNKERLLKENKKRYELNKEKILEKCKEYRKANKQKYKEYSKEYQKQRRKKDQLFKLKSNLRTRTSQAFRNKGYSKNTKTQDMLGVDWEVAKQHIERQFKKGMSWDNYGEWHIDHIIPLASANTPERLKKLCHYTNLQPMWAVDNLIKSDSINGQQTLLRI